MEGGKTAAQPRGFTALQLLVLMSPNALTHTLLYKVPPKTLFRPAVLGQQKSVVELLFVVCQQSSPKLY